MITGNHILAMDIFSIHRISRDYTKQVLDHVFPFAIRVTVIYCLLRHIALTSGENIELSRLVK